MSAKLKNFLLLMYFFFDDIYIKLKGIIIS